MKSLLVPAVAIVDAGDLANTMVGSGGYVAIALIASRLELIL